MLRVPGTIVYSQHSKGWSWVVARNFPVSVESNLGALGKTKKTTSVLLRAGRESYSTFDRFWRHAGVRKNRRKGNQA